MAFGLCQPRRKPSALADGALHYTLMRFHQSPKSDAMPRPTMATGRPPDSRWRLPPRPELCSPRAAYFNILRFFDDPQAPGLGPGTGSGGEPAEGRAVSGGQPSRSATTVGQRVGPGARLTRIARGMGAMREHIGWCADRELAPGRGGTAPMAVAQPIVVAHPKRTFDPQGHLDRDC